MSAEKSKEQEKKLNELAEKATVPAKAREAIKEKIKGVQKPFCK